MIIFTAVMHKNSFYIHADISAKIERLEAAERAAALVAKPVKATQQAPGISIKAEPKQYTGAGMTRLVMSIAAAQGNVQDAAKFAAEELNDPSVSMAINTAAASGGVLIPQNLHSEVIELLRDRTIVRKLGARSIPLPNGNMALPRLAGGATASYTGEGKDAKVSEARFDDVKLTAKTMIAMVPISNQLIGRAGYNVEQLVLQDILTAISVREDKAFMRDDGTGDTPVGMKARATEWNRLLPWEAAAEVNLQTIDTYLDSIILMAMDGKQRRRTRPLVRCLFSQHLPAGSESRCRWSVGWRGGNSGNLCRWGACSFCWYWCARPHCRNRSACPLCLHWCAQPRRDRFAVWSCRKHRKKYRI
ncbi:phage major capsid protein [Citrobacter freundii]|uniref:phage major capsid protein n=1 Tax=Citrobacter freundii TaxID=546 RepID=UPI001EE712B7|nr:phage major capsid protein [Citrobacter freundii]